MLKSLHLFLAGLVLISFMGRILYAELNQKFLENPRLKLLPHVIDSLLLLSGAALVFQGNWLIQKQAWLVAKFIVLLAYIFLGMLAMRAQGGRRWLIAGAAILCFLLIGNIAINKHLWLFF